MDIEEIINLMDRRNLTLDENETVLRMQGDDRDVWHVWSNDPVMIRRIHKKGNKVVDYDNYGVFFDLDSSQVRFFSPISDKERERLRQQGRENLKLLREEESNE